MTPRSELELEGSFLTHPFAELLREISGAKLYGSLRVTEGEKKCIFYFKGGNVVFAVSNARSARLFDILLRQKRITTEELAKVPDFGKDMELANYLQQKGLLTKGDCDRLFTQQIEGILVDALSWTRGSWAFSSLARIRDGLGYAVDTRRIITEYSRCISNETVLGRFRSLTETFERSELPIGDVALSPDEAFILSRVEDAPTSAARIASISGTTEADALHMMYTLWLSGYLERLSWQPAFAADTVRMMRHAKLELKKEAIIPHSPNFDQVVVPEPEPQPEPEAVAEKEPISMEEYLERVENAVTYYDVLGVDSRAEIDEMKRAYFALAKVFHPDRFHATGGSALQRIQRAFTELAQAHETLKNPESRELYDYRMRKEIAAREKARAAGNSASGELQLEQAAENFQDGFSLLMDDQAEEALPFLARAAFYAPGNAKYHAYYGKALSFDESQRHKAESEMQTAVKLDPQNPTYRILLAEFFVQYNLTKRAEGELRRLLAIFPSNREAKDMLAELQQ